MKLKVLLLPLAATFLFSGYPPTQPTDAKQPVKVSQSAWRQFRSTEGAFNVLMPGNPRQFRQPQKTSIGQVDVRGFIVEQYGGTVAYVVMYADVSDKSPQKINYKQLFDGASDRTLKNTRGKLLNQRNLQMQGYPGREFTVGTRGVVIKNRMYFAKPRIYQVMVVSTTDKEANLSKSITGFLDSFSLRSRR
jgi:hypothetical protein